MALQLAVISDSHGDRAAIARFAPIARRADGLIHLGDGGGDICHMRLFERPTWVVRGNCDLMSRVPDEITPSIAGHRALMCHGHLYQVKRTLTPLYLRAREVGAQIALFGHTHAPLALENEGILILNPGALASGCYALLDLGASGIRAQLKRL